MNLTIPSWLITSLNLGLLVACAILVFWGISTVPNGQQLIDLTTAQGKFAGGLGIGFISIGIELHRTWKDLVKLSK